MKKKLISLLLAAAMTAALIPAALAEEAVSAVDASISGTDMPEVSTMVEYGQLHYQAYADHIEITGCDWEATEVDIPAKIDGLPVTSIGSWAFSDSKGLLSVTIPSGVTNIAQYAFYGCVGLTSLSLSGSVSIGEFSFYGCSGLKSVSIGGGSIGSFAFSGCVGLTSVTLGDGVTSIGSSAFQGCTGLTGINIPSGVTSIGTSAFSGCTGLKSIEVSAANTQYKSVDGVLFSKDGTTLIQYPCGRTDTSYTVPAGVTSINGSAFNGCKSLSSIEVSAANTAFKSVGGVLYNKEGTTLVQFPGGNTNTSFVVPDGVTSIGASAFYGRTGLKNITIPSSVTSIGSSAFYGCTGLTEITVPDSVTSMGNSVFTGCTGLKTVTIGDGVTSIGISAFRNCANLTSVSLGKGIISIGSSAFYGCKNLTSINIPSGVTSIGDSAFSECKSLSSVSIGSGSIGEYAFDGCSSLRKVTLGDGVTSIGNYAFINCESLTSINIPSGVTSIGSRAFSNCEGLTSLSLPGSVTSIGDSAFSGCSGLTSINIPSGVTSIEMQAFSGCTALTTINISNGVTSIGRSAFYNCKSLTSIKIPDSVTDIGEWAFYGCTAVTSLTVGSGLSEDTPIESILPSRGKLEILTMNSGYIGDEAFKNHANLRSVTLGEGVSSLGSDAFMGCTSLTSISIPGSVGRIGDEAFRGCTGLTRVTMGEGVMGIGDGAFRACNNLASVNIPSSVTSIGSGAFWDCSSLTSVTIPAGITRIDGFTFSGCSSLTSVNIPASVTEIGGYAFKGCESLVVINIPGGVTSIGEVAFEDCSSLKRVIIPSGVKTISGSLFSGCSSLTSVNIPAGVTYIGDSAFKNCSSLPHINIPDGVTYIGGAAFYGCKSLTSLSLPSSLREIGTMVITLSGITSIALPEGITSLYSWRSVTVGHDGNHTYDGTFLGTNLTSIRLPVSLTSIGSWAFQGSNYLKEVYYEGSMEQWNSFNHAYYSDPKSGGDGYYHCGIVASLSDKQQPKIFFGGGGSGGPSDGGKFPEPEEPEEEEKDQASANATVNGHGTAYGWFKISYPDGLAAAHEKVIYEIDGVKLDEGITDADGYLCAKIENVSESKVYSVNVHGDNIRELEGTVNVTVKPLEFSSTYEAYSRSGLSGSLGTGVGLSVGELEAKAGAADIGAELSVQRGLSITREYKDGKNSLSVTAKQNATGALMAETGLWAGVKASSIAGIDAKVASINGKASYGETIGVTYEDDDFNVDDPDDVWNLSRFMLGVILDNSTTNVAAKYIASRLTDPIKTSHSRGSTAVVGSGASLGVVEGDIAGENIALTLGGVDGTLVFDYSAEKKKNGTAVYSSGTAADVGYKLFEASGRTANESEYSMPPIFGKNFISNAFELQVTKDGYGNLDELSLITEKNNDKNIYWYVKTRTDKIKYSYSGDEAKALAAQTPALSKFANNKKVFFNPLEIKAASGVLTNADRQGRYSASIEYRQGRDLDFSLGVKLLLGAAINMGFTGIEGYEYEKENGRLESGKVYIEAQSDIDADVSGSFYSISHIMDPVASRIADFIEACMDTAKGWLGGAIDSAVEAGQAAVGWAGDRAADVRDWYVDIIHPSGSVGSMAIMAAADGVSLLAAPSVATTVGEPYIISVTDGSGEIVTDLSESPLLLTLEYTKEQLSAAGVSDGDVAVYYWDEDRCVYVYMGGEANNGSVSLAITKPGQYILAADNCPPAVSAFKASDRGRAPEISAVVSDMSGIAGFEFRIDGKTLVNMENIEDYYDFTTGRFVYSVTDKLADGKHRAEIYAADSVGNELIPPAALEFTVNNRAPSIDEVSGLPAVITGPINVSAKVSGDDIAYVLLNVRVEDPEGNGYYTSYEMTGKNGEYTASIEKPEPGMVMSIWVSAYNTDGNSAESPRCYAATEPEDGSALLAVTAVKGNQVEVAVLNGAQLTGGTVILAVYSPEGELVQALTKEAAEKTVFDNVDLDGNTIKIMLWNSTSGMSPLAGYTRYGF